MDTTVPAEIQRIRALMQHHVDSEPEASDYTLRMVCQGWFTRIEYEFAYMSGSHKMKIKPCLRVWPNTRSSPEEKITISMSMEPDSFLGTPQAKDAIAYGGIFIKAGNLMKQIQEIV